MATMIMFFIVFFIGALFGFGVAALFCAAGDGARAHRPRAPTAPPKGPAPKPSRTNDRPTTPKPPPKPAPERPSRCSDNISARDLQRAIDAYNESRRDQ